MSAKKSKKERIEELIEEAQILSEQFQPEAAKESLLKVH